MPYPLNPELQYLMPTHFGPMSGPRQGPGDKKFPFGQSKCKVMSVSVNFLTNAEQLRDFLPPGFELMGEPVVTVSAQYLTELEWLAGRGYNVLGVTFPVVYQGEKDRAVGPFLTVMWESLADPIITGREQLGWSKIWCELPEPVIYNGETHCTASWLGFRFIDIKVSNMKEIDPVDYPAPAVPPTDDTIRGSSLHYKYMPRSGEWGKEDVAYATLSPEIEKTTKSLMKGDGTVEFHKARWEDMPTQYMIPNAFNALEIKEYRGASIEKSVIDNCAFSQSTWARILY